MILILDEVVERSLIQKAAEGAAGPLLLVEFSATLNLEEDLIHLNQDGRSPWPRASNPSVALPCYWCGFTQGGADPHTAPAYPLGIPDASAKEALLIGVVQLEGVTPGQQSLSAFFFPSPTSLPQVCDIEVVRLDTDIFSRVQGIFDTRVLAPKTVSVIGVGSGGSLGAVELAKSGVGNFNLVDFDRLLAHNVARHACGLDDVGRFKTRAVRDAILRHNPRASVVCHETDITQDGGLLDQIVAASDLVFVATDNELSRYLINDACIAQGKPAVYGAAYERAFAGEVIRVIPGKAGCYACVRQGMASTMRSISSQQVFDYTDDSQLPAEPGLGLGIAFIALIHAKLALLTLLRGTGSALEDIDAEMIIWTNSARPEDGELFERPLVRHLVRVAKAENCPACSWLAGADDADALEDELGPR